jgi:REP element-mobilizing transposase RayT
MTGAIHVVQRIRRGLPTLRTPRTYRALERAFRAGKQREGFRLVHYSVQHDHLHLVVDADDKRTLATGMQGLAIRIAKALNRRWNRRGKGAVFADRYFAKLMTSFRQIKRTLAYVLNNGRKHGAWTVRGRPDPFSSAPWKTSYGLAPDYCRPLRSAPLALPRSFDLATALVHGLDVNARPGQRFDFSSLPASIDALT